MPQFQTSRESQEKLWVKTPFPVSHAVWDFFVFKVFPPFDIDTSRKSSGRNPPALSPFQESEGTWNYKYLNRGGIFDGVRRDDIAEIADGQWGYYWRHAYLPDDAREGLAKARWGLIHVPEMQASYLDTIARDLGNKGKELEETLLTMTEREKEAIGILSALLTSHISKTSPDYMCLRTKLIRDLSGQGFKDMNECSRALIGGIRGDRTYFHGPNNNLRHLVAIEFLKNLDSVFRDALSKQGSNMYLKDQLDRLHAPMLERYNGYR